MANDPGKAWRCTVCGYVHRGSEPPQWCPVCGSPASEYEAFEEAPAATRAPVHRERCLNCNYIHTGDKPPKECPICASPADCFEPVPNEATEEPGAGRVSHVVVVGAGIAGLSAVESLRNVAPNAEITLISKESDLPYYRLNLTRYLAGEIDASQLPIHPAGWYDEQKIELLAGAEIGALLPEEQAVQLMDGRKVSYEKLIMTVGAHPFVPPFPAYSGKG